MTEQESRPLIATTTRPVRDHFIMGQGLVMVSPGFLDGLPTIFFKAAPEPGVLGAPANVEGGPEAFVEGATCISFASSKALLAHLDLIKSLADLIHENLPETFEVSEDQEARE